MTEKRYFKRMWEDEFYIFDSQTISEKEFDEKVEYEDYQAFADSLMGDEVVDRLNELDKENRKLTNEINLSKLNLREKNEGFDKLHKMYMGQIEENKELKSILQDIGLIMSNEEVRNVRDEIASKLIKPVCKGNGFDVDVNTENGFTIIPKEVNNDRE